MVPTPFSCTRTRKSSRPRSTGRCVPGARPAEVAPGMVKRSPPRLLLWLAWICALLRVLSDGGGCGDVAAGWPAVVVVGGGGGGVVVRAGAAGAVRRAGRGFGASTVTCGIATAGGVPGSAGGAAGAGGAGCGAGVSGAGVGVGGVSDGVVVVGGVSGGVAGVCGDATPAKQSSTSAELLSRSARLL